MKQRSILKKCPQHRQHYEQDAPGARITACVTDGGVICNASLVHYRETVLCWPVCGRNVNFKLETIPADKVEMATMVWLGNERDQDLLNETSLADLVPSFLTSGQQNPAFARKTAGIIEVADGSRRRKTAIITGCDYRVLVGDLDDEQMQWLSQIGNDYRPTSAYERGKKYQRRLKDFDGSVKALAEAEGVDRNIITRCINTAGLPKDIIAIFQTSW
ncbi:plasmid-partitioning protein [Klebsiella pneumoniae]|uniref:Plasmid-partitioning protein n=1 Tax=Klebsiella pneumoniae TaxID=573 RepID=A0A378H6R6_KLEPN|nr:plasmid-partitioning protein [Klebsiella pneumoniae]